MILCRGGVGAASRSDCRRCRSRLGVQQRCGQLSASCPRGGRPLDGIHRNARRYAQCLLTASGLSSGFMPPSSPIIRGASCAYTSMALRCLEQQCTGYTTARISPQHATQLLHQSCSLPPQQRRPLASTRPNGFGHWCRYRRSRVGPLLPLLKLSAPLLRQLRYEHPSPPLPWLLPLLPVSAAPCSAVAPHPSS